MTRSLLITVFTLFILNIALGKDNATYVFREPKGWGAVYKYCIACHSAKSIDGVAGISRGLWSDRVEKCTLYMASRGYVLPTKADKEAIINLLDSMPNGQFYFVKPKRGSLAYP